MLLAGRTIQEHIFSTSSEPLVYMKCCLHINRVSEKSKALIKITDPVPGLNL